MMPNACLLENIGFDGAENEPANKMQQQQQHLLNELNYAKKSNCPHKATVDKFYGGKNGAALGANPSKKTFTFNPKSFYSGSPGTASCCFSGAVDFFRQA